MKTQGLETVFKEATQRHESLGLLYSQWSFDKELIAKALQNIVSIFPHYSRHDASHSRQIIVNIERMLGDRISKLTATDMWLLLESAYSHDIGMVITQKQINDMDTPEFRGFVEDLAYEPGNDLSGFAKKWLEEKLALPVNKDAHTVFDEYKQLLAEWYRRKHPETAENIVRNPFEEIGLSSPRNELLPKRLFAALGAICRSHGQSFEEVMKLPFSEAGMGTEDCHPRYVACLLRMGDLLDIDDNRFCPVMMRMSGVELPHTSHVHYEKHQSIKHFRLDAERIKVEVACPTPESYEVAHDWFKWLEQEYHSQSQHWSKIVPSKKMGRLPTLAPPKVILNKPYVTLSEGRRPSFEMDNGAILALLRGTGLYKSKFDSIREILQNAVDATLMWIWHEHAALVMSSNPLSDALQEIYLNHRIVVDFKSVNGSDKVRLRIKDSGIGISRHDLFKMLTVGGSARNLEKTREIRKMPNWFRPAGQFGIGLQSIYLLSDSFKITTRSRLTNEAFKLDFNVNDRSSLVITQLAPEDLAYGSTVEVDVDIDKFPQGALTAIRRKDEQLKHALRLYDFTSHGSDLAEYEKLRIMISLHNFNSGSPIKLSLDTEALTGSSMRMYYCEETNILLREISFTQARRYQSKACFRGQPFQNLDLELGFYDGIVDFYGKQAAGFVSYNRDVIIKDAVSEAKALGRRAVIRYILSNYEELSCDEKPLAAAIMLLHGGATQDPRFRQDVLSLPIKKAAGGSITLGDFIDRVKAGDIGVTLYLRQWGKMSDSYSDYFVVYADDNVSDLMRFVASLNGLFWCDCAEGRFITMNSWSNEDVFPISQESLERLISVGDEDVLGRRLLFPAWGEYRLLALSVRKPWFRIHEHISWQDEYLLFPYVFDMGREAVQDVSEDVVRWIYEHRKYEDASLELIRALYIQLADEIAGRLASTRL